MKLFSKLSILSVLLVAVISVIAGCGGDTAGEKKFLNIATGGTAGTYYPIGGAMAEILNNNIQGMNASAQSTGATVANINMLSYKYLDRAGNIHKGVAAPCRLEYDCAQHRIRLILWLQAENRAVKLNVNRLQQINLSNLTYGKEIELSFKQFLNKNKTSVTIQLLPKYNAVDRCFSIFSSYDKQAIYDEDNDSYTLIITYYHFDEEEIINYILSLGAAVVVTEPLHLRHKIIQRLQQQLELCCSEQ